MPIKQINNYARLWGTCIMNVFSCKMREKKSWSEKSIFQLVYLQQYIWRRFENVKIKFFRSHASADDFY